MKKIYSFYEEEKGFRPENYFLTTEEKYADRNPDTLETIEYAKCDSVYHFGLKKAKEMKKRDKNILFVECIPLSNTTLQVIARYPATTASRKAPRRRFGDKFYALIHSDCSVVKCIYLAGNSVLDLDTNTIKKVNDTSYLFKTIELLREHIGGEMDKLKTELDKYEKLSISYSSL